MINKIIQLFNPKDRSRISLLVFFLFIAAMLEMVGVGLIMPFIAVIQSPEYIQNNKWLNVIYNILRADSYNNFIILCSLLILGFYIAKNLITGWIIYWQSKFLAKAESELSSNLLDKYLSMPYEKFLGRNTAELVNNTTMETSLLFAGLVKPFFIVVSDTLVVIAILALLLYIAPGATLAAIATIGFCSIIFYILLRKKLKELGKMRHYHREKMVQWVNQSLGSMKEIIVSGRKEFFINSFWKHAYEMIGQQTFYETIVQLPRIIIESFGVIVLVIITIILINQPGSFLSTIALFAMAAFRLMPAINRITASATKVRYYNHTLNALHNDLTNIVTDQLHNPAKEERVFFTKEIIIKNALYSYPNAETAVIENLNLTISKGDSVGIIGPSGSGKSTFVDLLLGLLQPKEGKILVDGKDIRDNLASWRRHISYMPQTVYLTDDTIKRNVALGIPDNKIDENLVWESLKKAQADEFISKQPEGLEMIIGERGSRLSGGQRQRIGIARALYNKPDILILDEATSALDSQTEQRICSTIKEIAKDITIIAISHQPALISITNKVYRMDKGKLILEEGK